jgi:hypothetical protein
MSYTVAIVAPPIPARDAEAWDVLDGIIDQQGPVLAVFRTLHDRLTARFPCLCSLPDDQVDDGVWSDGPLWNNFGHRAAVLGFDYRRADVVLPFLIEAATSLDLAVFDWATNQIHRPGGLKSLTLTVEDKPVLRGPTLEQVLTAVDALTPRGGPGFLILEVPGENFVQAAGGNGAYTAEWRESSGGQSRHWVAGVPGQPSKEDIAIPTNGLQVTIKENERLDAADVKLILTAFAECKGRPAKFVWRDITERFA